MASHKLVFIVVHKIYPNDLATIVLFVSYTINMSGVKIFFQIVIFFHRLVLYSVIWYILNVFSIKLLSIFISGPDMMLLYRYEGNKRLIIKT